MIHIVGAGPGAVDLITVRGQKLLSEADVVIYAGSLVSRDLLGWARQDARIYDSASMDREQVLEVMEPPTIVFYRFLMASCGLGLILSWKRKLPPLRIFRDPRWLVLLLIARGVYLRALVTGQLSEVWFSFLLNTASLSVGLGLFNLGPIPPLDGSKVLAVLLPDRAYNWLMRYERFGMLLLLAVISVGIGSNALDSAIRWTFTLLCRLVGFEV